MPAKGKYLLNDQELKNEALYRKFSCISQYQPLVLLLGLSMLSCAALLILFFALQLGTLFVAFVCFTAASSPKFITATVLEFVITSCLLLLYMFKLNKRLTLFFWPLIDVFNSAFAALYLIVLSIVAVTTYSVTGTLVGGIVGFLSAVLLCVDFYLLLKNITFNKPRSDKQSKENPGMHQ